MLIQLKLITLCILVPLDIWLPNLNLYHPISVTNHNFPHRVFLHANFYLYIRCCLLKFIPSTATCTTEYRILVFFFLKSFYPVSRSGFGLKLFFKQTVWFLHSVFIFHSLIKISEFFVQGLKR